MDINKLAALTNKLIAQTEKKQLAWQPTIRDDVFQVTFPEYSLQISMRSSREGDDFIVSIFNEDGVMVEQFSDADLDHEMRDSSPFVFDEPPYYKKMKQLYDAARRIALGSEKAVDTILEVLNGERNSL